MPNRWTCALILSVVLASFGCTRSDQSEIRRDLRRAGQEIRHDAQQAKREVQRDMNQAKREVREATRDLR